MNAAGRAFLVCLGTSFFVLAEPAPTDMAFFVAMFLTMASMNVHLPSSIFTYLLFSFAFMLTNMTSAIACDSFRFCFRYMGITAYLFLIPPLMVHLVAINGVKFLPKMYRAFFVAILISAMSGILATIGILPGPAELYYRADDRLRLSPFFKDPNVYAPYLGAGLILLLGYSALSKSSLWKSLLGMLLVWIPLLLAFSRAAWLAIAVSAITFAIGMLILGRGLPSGERFSRVASVGIFIFLPSSAIILYYTGLLDFFEHRLGLQSYDAERFETHAEAVKVALENPFGIGPGHFVGQTHFPDSKFAYAAHNVYAKVMVENGFLGIILFLAITIFALIDLARAARLKTPRYPVQLALIAGIVGILVNGYFIDTLHWRHLFVLLGFAYSEVYVAQVTLSIRKIPNATIQKV